MSYTKHSEDRNKERTVDKKWNQIFFDYNVLDYVDRYGSFKITATEINRYKEVRLMTTFDYATNLPDIFYDNDLAILPTNINEYTIGRFDAYQKLQTTDKTVLKARKEIQFPTWIKTLSPHNITSESTLLNVVGVSGMLNDLFNEQNIIQTVSGQMPSKPFSFKINQKQNPKPFEINVQNTDIEINATFETPDKLVLVQAKNTTTNSFFISQLYYSYQYWAKQVNKEIVPIFLQYSNTTYNFSTFKFTDVYNYNSLELVSRDNYIFKDERATLDDIVRIQKNVTLIESDNAVAFPVANTFSRVLGVVEAIHQSLSESLSTEDLTLVNDFVMRQADYYSRAAMFLNFVTLNADNRLELTRLGKDYMRANRKVKNLRIAKQILEHRVFNYVFLRGVQRGKPLNASDTYNYLESEGFFEPRLSPSTKLRRASTVSSWVRYLFDMVDDSA